MEGRAADATTLRSTAAQPRFPGCRVPPVLLPAVVLRMAHEPHPLLPHAAVVSDAQAGCRLPLRIIRWRLCADQAGMHDAP